MVKVTSLLAKAGSGIRFRFGVRAWTEMEIQFVKGMQRLKLVSSKNNSVFKGLTYCPFSLLGSTSESPKNFQTLKK